MSVKYLMGVVALGALAACGGGDDGDGDDGFLTTNGVLSEVEIPSDGDLANLPTEVADFVNAFVAANESLTQTQSRPMGTAEFTGEYGFGFDDDDNPTVVIGAMAMSVNFDGGGISGTVSNLVGDSDGVMLNIGNDLAILGVIDNQSDIAGTVAGDVELDGETYGFEASITGAFAGNGAETALGTTQGTVTNPDTTQDGISGYFLAEKN